MKNYQLIKLGVKTAVLVTVAGAVSGCFGPTYGTGKTAVHILLMTSVIPCRLAERIKQELNMRRVQQL